MPNIAAIQSQTQTQSAPTAVGTLKLRPTAEAAPDYLKELQEKGYVVVKNVISPEKAQSYVDRALDWLESFDLGFDRNDKSTWDINKLPPHARGGLYNAMGLGHEQFLWDIRSEPALIDVFSKLWGTDELLVSFDGGNFGIPYPREQLGDQASPWPHYDQAPTKRGFHCIQGIMNLLPNGPKDGGLMVMDGSFPLHEEFLSSEVKDDRWHNYDSYHHTAEELKFFEERGCTYHKVTAGPGDVILWDSRTIHYGAPTESDNPRMATYVCYKPASLCNAENLEKKLEAFKENRNTSHDPTDFRIVPKRHEEVRSTKLPEDKQPVLSERAKKLAGLVPY